MDLTLSSYIYEIVLLFSNNFDLVGQGDGDRGLPVGEPGGDQGQHCQRLPLPGTEGPGSSSGTR